MQPGYKTELQYFSFLFILLSIFGWNIGYLLPVYLVGLAGYLIWIARRTLRLRRWLSTGMRIAPDYIPGIFGDIAEQCYRTQLRNERSKEMLRAQIKRTDNLTNALREGIFILKDGSTLNWWNPAAEKLLNLRKEDRGNPIRNLLREPKFVAYVQQQDFSHPLEMSAPNNAAQQLLFNGAIFDGNDVVIVVRDVSRMRQLEQMRKDFVANISHELRTPLTVLTGYIETLQDSLDPQNRGWGKALKQMSAQTDRMNHLAVDLITLSQLESKDAGRPMSKMPLLPLLQQIRQDAEALCGQEGLVILDDIDPTLSLMGDQKELYSAFSNLVFNAVRHNPEGTKITLAASQHGSDNLIVSVTDNGSGIEAKHIPRLTERFYRVDSSRATTSGGTGLGLAIVKHVLARHQGRLQIRSILTKGSTFSCHFEQSDEPNR